MVRLRRIKCHAIWCCKCDCGEQVSVRGTKLITGRQISCGCQRADPAVRSAARAKVDPARRKEIAAQGGRANTGRRGMSLTAFARRSGASEERIVQLIRSGAIDSRIDRAGRIRLTRKDLAAAVAAKSEKNCA